MDWTVIWFIRNNGENLLFQWLPFMIIWCVMKTLVVMEFVKMLQIFSFSKYTDLPFTKFQYNYYAGNSLSFFHVAVALKCVCTSLDILYELNPPPLIFPNLSIHGQYFFLEKVLLAVPFKCLKGMSSFNLVGLRACCPKTYRFWDWFCCTLGCLRSQLVQLLTCQIWALIMNYQTVYFLSQCTHTTSFENK